MAYSYLLPLKWSISQLITILRSSILNFYFHVNQGGAQNEFRLIQIPIFVSRSDAMYQQKIIPLRRTERKRKLALLQNFYYPRPPSSLVSLGLKSDPVALMSTVPCVPLFSKICKTISLVLDVMRC
jgi:hypothetical protein